MRTSFGWQSMMMRKSENFSPQEAAFFGQIFPCVKVYFNKGEIKFCPVFYKYTNCTYATEQEGRGRCILDSTYK